MIRSNQKKDLNEDYEGTDKDREAMYSWLEKPRRADQLKDMLKFIQYVTETEAQFKIIRGWEKRFEKKEVDEAKQTFLALEPSPSEMVRWRVALFDSVGSHFVIGKKIIPNTFVVGFEDAPFAVTGKCQPEMRKISYHLHCPDWQSSWGVDVSPKAVAWRPKLDGTPVDTVAGQMRCCHFYTLTKTVVAGELTSEGLYQIYPYGDPLDVSGIAFLEHPWRTFSSAVRNVNEGLVLLLEDGTEARVKRYPSVELKDYSPKYKGVWEWESTQTGLRPVRPRTYETGIKALCTALSLEEVNIPTSGPLLEYKKTGPFTTVVEHVGSDNGPTILIDTMFRQMTTVVVGNIATSVLNGIQRVHPVDFPMIQGVIGAKACVECKGKRYIFKDKQKKWDFIGGHIDPLESSEMAMKREWKEETFLECPALKFLGVSSEENFFTYMYLIKVDKLPQIEGSQWAEWNPTLHTVPWFFRLFVAFNQALREKEPVSIDISSTNIRLTMQGQEVLKMLKLHMHTKNEIVVNSVDICISQKEYAKFRAVWGHVVMMGFYLLEETLSYQNLERINDFYTSHDMKRKTMLELMDIAGWLGGWSSAHRSDMFSTLRVVSSLPITSRKRGGKKVGESLLEYIKLTGEY